MDENIGHKQNIVDAKLDRLEQTKTETKMKINLINQKTTSNLLSIDRQQTNKLPALTSFSLSSKPSWHREQTIISSVEVIVLLLLNKKYIKTVFLLLIPE